MGVGAGLYMCDVVKKVHVRYLISWWVLVLCLFIQRWLAGVAWYTLYAWYAGVSGKQRCLHPLLTSAPKAYISHARLSLQSDNPHPVRVSRDTLCKYRHSARRVQLLGSRRTIENKVNYTIKLFRCTNRSHSVTLAYLSILV